MIEPGTTVSWTPAPTDTVHSKTSGGGELANLGAKTLRKAFAVANNYRVGQKQPYWLLDNLTVFNNVFYAAGERDGYNVMVDVGATHVTLANNVVARGHAGGVTVSTVGSNASTRDAFYASANNTRNLFWRKRVDHGSNAGPSSCPRLAASCA